MTSQPSNLFDLARSKLNPPSYNRDRDSFSLHRWVLLKNSIIQSLPLVAASSSETQPSVDSTDEEEPEDDAEADSFMFPDAGKLVEVPSAEVNASEAAWLDSLLETLGEDDDFNSDLDTQVSVVPVDDDEDLAFVPSPPISPMSSAEDLTSSQFFYPYLVPYPPYHPPLISSYHFDTPHASSPPYDHPLPYSDTDDLEDFPPVPDAIEDTSDDESDAPPTPGQSLSSLSLDPASIPLPAENSRLRHSTPRIYTEDDDYFYPFDPLPFPNNYQTPINYTEC